MKTSISLNDKILEAIDNYRRTQLRIPKLSEAIRDLLWKALIPKKEITEIPKDSILFEGKTVSIEKKRQRFLIRFNPGDLKKLRELIPENGPIKVDVALCRADTPIEPALTPSE